MINHYHRLQVHPQASPEVIKAAYRALMRDSHPDVHDTIHGKTAAKLNAAYEIISDPAKRQQYDRDREKIEGTIIGGFKVERAIAEGGFGKTYQGSHLLVGEPVCIKHCSRISATDTEILIEEAKAMWDLRHFAIPAVRDLIQLDDGSVALVMSFIEGLTLAEVVEKLQAKKYHLEPEDVCWMAERIFNALSYMHRFGVVHGDLKPGNIMIQPESHTVVLVDFGLAAIKPTHTDGSKGYTEVFAPPEQLRGSPLIPQSDFYSLGMTMLYALSNGDLSHVQRHEVPSTVPKPMCDFIYRLIVRNPLDRPDWRTEDIMKTFKEMRYASFGRINSGMKPLHL